MTDEAFAVGDHAVDRPDSARGGVERELYPWGDAPPEQVPDCALRWKKGPEPVGLYAPNRYGLYNAGVY